MGSKAAPSDGYRAAFARAASGRRSPVDVIAAPAANDQRCDEAGPQLRPGPHDCLARVGSLLRAADSPRRLLRSHATAAPLAAVPVVRDLDSPRRQLNPWLLLSSGWLQCVSPVKRYPARRSSGRSQCSRHCYVPARLPCASGLAARASDPLPQPESDVVACSLLLHSSLHLPASSHLRGRQFLLRLPRRVLALIVADSRYVPIRPIAEYAAHMYAGGACLA